MMYDLLLDSKETTGEIPFNLTVSGEFSDYYFKISGSNWGRHYELEIVYHDNPDGDDSDGDSLSDILAKIPGYPALGLISITLFSVGLMFYHTNKRKKGSH